MSALADCFTEAVLTKFERCVQQALIAVGSSDPAAAKRVQMVGTGLEYTRKTRDLLAAAAAVRNGSSDRAHFEKVRAETLAFYRTLALSWAVSIDHNYSYVRRGLGLKPHLALNQDIRQIPVNRRDNHHRSPPIPRPHRTRDRPGTLCVAHFPHVGDLHLRRRSSRRNLPAGPCGFLPTRSRYFCDAAGREVLSAGSHTWNNLVDMGRSDPPEAFDFDAYLDFLGRCGHNFIRLWTWASTTWDTRANGKWGKNYMHNVGPLPWARTGNGAALDGKPKFDLKQFEVSVFRAAAGAPSARRTRRGIYVSVMLFEGWGLMHGNRRPATKEEWAWRYSPLPSAQQRQRHRSGRQST